MSTRGFSGLLSSGFGRRILFFFTIAGILPVLLIAASAYWEVVREQQIEVGSELREHSKHFGSAVLERLTKASDNAAELVRIINQDGVDALDSQAYLLQNFESITLVNGTSVGLQLYGHQPISIDVADINPQQLATGKSQLLSGQGSARKNMILLHAGAPENDIDAVYAFALDSKFIWQLGDSAPYLTDFCALATNKTVLFCTFDIDTGLYDALLAKRALHSNTVQEWKIAGETRFSNMWQLFLPGVFGHPPIDIISTQPKSHALMPVQDFEKIFPPALALAILLVGTLSFNLIGKSIEPLRRLKKAAVDLAQGIMDSRVDVRTGDEFESLANSFNDMASRLELQISTLKSLSEIDSMILSNAAIEDVAEYLIDCAIQTVDLEIAAVIICDSDSPNQARMFCGHHGHHTQERTAMNTSQNGENWEARQCMVSELDDLAPVLGERFADFGMSSVLILPVIARNEMAGMLVIGSRENSGFGNRRTSLCQDLSGRLGVALASAEREEVLYQRAHFDELTGLPNRQLLKDRLEQQLVQARRDEHRGAVLFLDLDRFKETNDVFGHSLGDQVLCLAAERIVSEVRESDTVARLGGDEFVVVMPEFEQHASVTNIAALLVSRLSEAFIIDGVSHFLGASIGIVVFPDDGNSVETLLRNADAAMYRAKDAGRSRFEFFSEKLNVESMRKIELERDLRKAFDDRELEVYYQPQFEFATGAICGAEALMRWSHRKLGMVPAQEFVRIAEESGLIVELGKWVVEQACVDLNTMIKKGLHPGAMSINVSARQLRETNFATDVIRIVRQHGIRPEYLVFEITETAVAQNRDTAVEILKRLRNVGIKIALDDFGTGYSSLSYLQHLPFDILKIDKSFVDVLKPGNISEKICRTIILMAIELEKLTVAEGVETAFQADFLRKNRCDKVQGYLYGRPMSGQKFIEFVEDQGFHTQRRKALEIIGS